MVIIRPSIELAKAARHMPRKTSQKCKPFVVPSSGAVFVAFCFNTGKTGGPYEIEALLSSLMVAMATTATVSYTQETPEVIEAQASTFKVSDPPASKRDTTRTGVESEKKVKGKSE